MVAGLLHCIVGLILIVSLEAILVDAAGSEVVSGFAVEENLISCESTAHFKCISDKRCIPRTRFCDGKPDCPDYSDEAYCGNKCDPTMFECQNGMCIQEMFRCDKENDCGDWSDELDCPATAAKQAPTVQMVCNQGQFFCDLTCVPDDWKCDGNKDCLSGADEEGCNRTYTTQEHVCDEGKFYCDVTCVSNEWKCDGTIDCPMNGADEKGCNQTNLKKEIQNTTPAYTQAATPLSTVTPGIEVLEQQGKVKSLPNLKKSIGPKNKPPPRSTTKPTKKNLPKPTKPIKPNPKVGKANKGPQARVKKQAKLPTTTMKKPTVKVTKVPKSLPKAVAQKATAKKQLKPTTKKQPKNNIEKMSADGVERKETKGL